MESIQKMRDKEKALSLALHKIARSLDKNVKILVALAEEYPDLTTHEEYVPADLAEAAAHIRTLWYKLL